MLCPSWLSKSLPCILCNHSAALLLFQSRSTIGECTGHLEDYEEKTRFRQSEQIFIRTTVSKSTIALSYVIVKVLLPGHPGPAFYVVNEGQV